MVAQEHPVEAGELQRNHGDNSNEMEVGK
jgi:hypothetical protein